MTDKLIIAAVTAGDEARDTIALGSALARAEGAHLKLARVWVSPLGSGDGFYEQAMRTEAERSLEELRLAVPADVECTAEALGATSIVRGLHELAASDDAEILVLGPSHVGKAVRAVRGDVSLGALHSAPCAVAVAPPGYHATDARLLEIVVGYDGSEECETALDAAAALAERTLGELRIVHVLETPYRLTEVPWLDPAGSEHWLASVRGDAQEQLDTARRRVGERVPVRTEIVEGIAADELARAAATADILVTGSRRYGPVKRLVLGSVTAGLIHHVAVPVLVLPRGARVPAAAA